jgi:hypothetical protein
LSYSIVISKDLEIETEEIESSLHALLNNLTRLKTDINLRIEMLKEGIHVTAEFLKRLRVP